MLIYVHDYQPLKDNHEIQTPQDLGSRRAVDGLCSGRGRACLLW